MSGFSVPFLGTFPKRLLASQHEIKERVSIGAVTGSARAHPGYDESRFDPETGAMPIESGNHFAPQDALQAANWFQASDMQVFGGITMTRQNAMRAWYGASKWMVFRTIAYGSASTPFPRVNPVTGAAADPPPAISSAGYYPYDPDYAYLLGGILPGNSNTRAFYTTAELDYLDSISAMPSDVWENSGPLFIIYQSDWYQCAYPGIPGTQTRLITKYPNKGTEYTKSADTLDASESDLMSNGIARVVPFSFAKFDEVDREAIEDECGVLVRDFFTTDFDGAVSAAATVTGKAYADSILLDSEPRCKMDRMDLIQAGAFSDFLGYAPLPSYEVYKHDAIPMRAGSRATLIWGDDFLLSVATGSRSSTSVNVGAKIQLFSIPFELATGTSGHMWDPLELGIALGGIQPVAIVSPIGFSEEQAKKLLPDVFTGTLYFSASRTVGATTTTALLKVKIVWVLNRDPEAFQYAVDRDNITEATAAFSLGFDSVDIPSTVATAGDTVAGYLNSTLISSMGQIGSLYVTDTGGAILDPSESGKILASQEIYGPQGIVSLDVQFDISP